MKITLCLAAIYLAVCASAAVMPAAVVTMTQLNLEADLADVGRSGKKCRGDTKDVS